MTTTTHHDRRTALLEAVGGGALAAHLQAYDLSAGQPRWAIEPAATDSDRLFFATPAGDRISVEWSKRSRSLSIEGCLGAELGRFRDPYDAAARHRPITVSALRTPDAVAREIVRRLLPAYRLELDRCRARATEDRNERQARAAVVAELARMAGVPVSTHSPDYVPLDAGRDWRGAARVQSSTSVKLELTLPPALAAQVAAFLLATGPTA